MSAPVRVLCPQCVYRYAHVVWSECPSCLGTGLLAAVVPGSHEGVPRWVVARAATLDGVQREQKIAAGLLSPDVEQSKGLPDAVHGDKQKSEIGRAAGKLLLSLGLRKPTVRRPAKRRTKADIEAEKLKKMALEGNWREDAERRKQERLAREKAERVAAAVLEDYRILHPEEFVEREETAAAMLTLGDLPVVNVRGWTSDAVVARRAANAEA